MTREQACEVADAVKELAFACAEGRYTDLAVEQRQEDAEKRLVALLEQLPTERRAL